MPMSEGLQHWYQIGRVDEAMRQPTLTATVAAMRRYAAEQRPNYRMALHEVESILSLYDEVSALISPPVSRASGRDDTAAILQGGGRLDGIGAPLTAAEREHYRMNVEPPSPVEFPAFPHTSRTPVRVGPPEQVPFPPRNRVPPMSYTPDDLRPLDGTGHVPGAKSRKAGTVPAPLPPRQLYTSATPASVGRPPEPDLYRTIGRTGARLDFDD